MNSVYTTTIQQDNNRVSFNVDLSSTNITAAIDVVELQIRNAINKPIEWIPFTSNWLSSRINDTSLRITIDAGKDLYDVGYLSGKYFVKYAFFKRIVGDTKSKPLQIKAFSSDRSEIRVICDESNSILPFLNLQSANKESLLPGLVLNFGNNEHYHVRDFTVDDITYPDSPYSIIFKLEDGESFNSNIQLNDTCCVYLQLFDPLDSTITLIPPTEERARINLRGPNFNAFNRSIYNDVTDFTTWDNILPTSGSEDALIFSLFVSKSNQRFDGIDYSSFEEFIHFSSAEERLHNFKYKLALIENYDEKITNYSTNLTGLLSGSVTSSGIFIENKQTLELKRQSILDSFDGFEYNLYYNSSSYESSSYGEKWPLSWPKQNDVKPYNLYSVTSSQAIQWFNGAITSASRYDLNNLSSLRYTLPEYIREDNSNESALLFTDMLGQHFDNLFLQIKVSSKLHSRQEDPYLNMSKSMFRDLISNLGLRVGVQSKNVSIWDYVLSDTSGSLLSGEARELELSNRLINNLPFLLQTKGTTRGVKALLNCYGIPSTILRVREFSGPVYSAPAYNVIDKNVWFFRADNRFGHNQSFHVNVDRNYEMIAVRFRLPSFISQSTSFNPIIEYQRPSAAGTGRIQSRYVSGSRGIITVESATFDGPFYNDEWWTVVVDKPSNTAHLICTEANMVKCHLSSSGVLKIPGGTGIHSIGDSYVGIGGSFVDYQSLQFFTTSFASNNELIQNIALYPDVLIGTTPSESIDNCIGYFPLGINGIFGPFNSGSATDIANLADVKYSSISGSFLIVSGTIQSGSEQISLYRPWVNGVFSRFVNDKIIFQSNSLSSNNLSLINHNEHVVNLEKDWFDSNRFGVYVSPADDINEDIVQRLFKLDMSNVLGDPRDDYESTFKYGNLIELQKLYFSKYKNTYHVNELFKLLTYFHSGVFNLIKQFAPSRSNTLTGLVLEPHILHHSKEKRRSTSEVENEASSVEINTQDAHILTGENNAYESIIDATNNIAITGSNSCYLGIISSSLQEISGDSYMYETSNIVTSSISIGGESTMFNVNDLNTREVSAGTYNLNNGSRYHFYQEYQHMPVTFSNFWASSNGGWNDNSVSAVSYRQLVEIKINGVVYTTSELGIIQTSASVSANTVALSQLISTRLGIPGFYCDNNLDLCWNTTNDNKVEYIKVDYTTIGSSSYWYPLSSTIQIPAVPYWQSEALMPFAYNSRYSTKRMTRTYFYSSSVLAKIGRAYSSSLSFAEVNDTNLDYNRRLRSLYKGTKISGKINEPSSESFDGKPILEISIVDSNVLIPQKGENNQGNLKFE